MQGVLFWEVSLCALFFSFLCCCSCSCSCSHCVSCSCCSCSVLAPVLALLFLLVLLFLFLLTLCILFLLFLSCSCFVARIVCPVFALCSVFTLCFCSIFAAVFAVFSGSCSQPLFRRTADEQEKITQLPIAITEGPPTFRALASIT